MKGTLMLLSELVALYRDYAAEEFVKHDRHTSTPSAIYAATSYLLEVEVPAERLKGRSPTASSDPPTDLPQLDLLAMDLPGAGGAAVRRLEQVPIDQLTREDLRDFLNHLCTKRHARGKLKGQPWTRKHVNDIRSRILRMFEWAKEEEHCPKAVLEELERCPTIKSGKKKLRRSTKIKAARHQAVFDLIEAIRADAAKLPRRSAYQRDLYRRRLLVAVVLELAWELGCRPHELVQLKPAEVVEDPDKPGGFLYLPSEWKTEHEDDDGDRRRMVCSKRAKALIDEAIMLRRTDGDQMRLDPFDDFDPDARLFLWAADHPYNARNACYNAIRRAITRAGLKHFTLLQVRHAFATRAVAVSVEGARVQLGHASLTTTMKYLDNDGKAVRELFDRLDASPGSEPTPPDTPTPASGSRTGTDDQDTPFRLRLAQ